MPMLPRFWCFLIGITVFDRMVNVHGHSTVRFRTSHLLRGPTEQLRPPDPQTLLTPLQLQDSIDKLYNWMSSKRSILTITGAGLSTESGIPDYRGNRGSYHEGHKPMIHDQFMTSLENRKQYWARGLVGWRSFDLRQPNAGHVALAELERNRKIGVTFDDSPDYHSPTSEQNRYLFGNGQQTLSIVTQNVDALHQRAGSVSVTELHGRISRLKCMQCGALEDRSVFTETMESLNREWLNEALASYNTNDMRPDGDAHLKSQNYNDLIIPPCTSCGTGFLKPDVVFFGDSVPQHRVTRCRAAVEASDGLLCIGTSLSVHSALRYARLAASIGTEVCILNVGETRAETEGLPGVTKIEAPIGRTLEGFLERLGLGAVGKRA